MNAFKEFFGIPSTPSKETITISVDKELQSKSALRRVSTAYFQEREKTPNNFCLVDVRNQLIHRGFDVDTQDTVDLYRAYNKRGPNGLLRNKLTMYNICKEG